MKFSTKTEYALICLAHMARRDVGGRCTVREMVSQEQYSAPYVEKIFQALKAAGVVVSFQGNQGGFALAKPASEITVRHVIDALEGATFDVFCERPAPEEMICNHSGACNLKPVWRKTKQLLDEFYDSITLEMLAKETTEDGCCCSKTAPAETIATQTEQNL